MSSNNGNDNGNDNGDDNGNDNGYDEIAALELNSVTSKKDNDNDRRIFMYASDRKNIQADCKNIQAVNVGTELDGISTGYPPSTQNELYKSLRKIVQPIEFCSKSTEFLMKEFLQKKHNELYKKANLITSKKQIHDLETKLLTTSPEVISGWLKGRLTINEQQKTTLIKSLEELRNIRNAVVHCNFTLDDFESEDKVKRYSYTSHFKEVNEGRVDTYPIRINFLEHLEQVFKILDPTDSSVQSAPTDDGDDGNNGNNGDDGEESNNDGKKGPSGSKREKSPPDSNTSGSNPSSANRTSSGSTQGSSTKKMDMGATNLSEEKLASLEQLLIIETYQNSTTTDDMLISGSTLLLFFIKKFFPKFWRHCAQRSLYKTPALHDIQATVYWLEKKNRSLATATSLCDVKNSVAKSDFDGLTLPKKAIYYTLKSISNCLEDISYIQNRLIYDELNPDEIKKLGIDFLTNVHVIMKKLHEGDSQYQKHLENFENPNDSDFKYWIKIGLDKEKKEQDLNFFGQTSSNSTKNQHAESVKISTKKYRAASRNKSKELVENQNYQCIDPMHDQ